MVKAYTVAIKQQSEICAFKALSGEKDPLFVCCLNHIQSKLYRQQQCL